MAKIFLSYRRDDEPGYVQALFGIMREDFLPAQIFFDIESISPGADFVQLLYEKVGQCEVMLAVIGKDWPGLTVDGKRRIDQDNDFVRIEIEAALARNMKIIPVLIRSAQMPRAEDLPTSLMPIARRNAVRLSQERFEQDCRALSKSLRKTLGVLESEDELRSSRIRSFATSSWVASSLLGLCVFILLNQQFSLGQILVGAEWGRFTGVGGVVLPTMVFSALSGSILIWWKVLRERSEAAYAARVGKAISAINVAIARAGDADLEFIQRHFVHHAGTLYLVHPNLASCDSSSSTEGSRALALNQLAGALHDLGLVRWPRRGVRAGPLRLRLSELEILRMEEVSPSDTDLENIRNEWRGTARTEDRSPALRNNGLFSKAERALALAGWSYQARHDIEVHIVSKATEMAPVIEVLNQSPISTN